jgi:hypothetical protein
MFSENYEENATLFVEEFVVWAHGERISFMKDGKSIGPLSMLNLYAVIIKERQFEMDQHVNACKQENICASCGEPGFPYCPAHQAIDEDEIAKQFPMSEDGEEGIELLDKFYPGGVRKDLCGEQIDPNKPIYGKQGEWVTYKQIEQNPNNPNSTS